MLTNSGEGLMIRRARHFVIHQFRHSKKGSTTFQSKRGLSHLWMHNEDDLTQVIEVYEREKSNKLGFKQQKIARIMFPKPFLPSTKVPMSKTKNFQATTQTLKLYTKKRPSSPCPWCLFTAAAIKVQLHDN